jgi:hypothetical protein
MPKHLTGAGLNISIPRPCPCSLFTGIHPRAKDAETARSQPFYEVSRTTESAYTSGEDAQESINKLLPFDSDPNVFILLAHDSVLFDVLPLFNEHPYLDVNDWQQKGYKGQTHWGFLNELPRKNHPGRKPLVDGLRHNDKLLLYGDDGEFHEQVAEVGKPHCEM